MLRLVYDCDWRRWSLCALFTFWKIRNILYVLGGRLYYYFEMGWDWIFAAHHGVWHRHRPSDISPEPIVREYFRLWIIYIIAINLSLPSSAVRPFFTFIVRLFVAHTIRQCLASKSIVLRLLSSRLMNFLLVSV